MTHPKNRKSPDHQNARQYGLVSPSGQVFIFRNMADFVEQHKDLFDPIDLVCKPQSKRAAELGLALQRSTCRAAMNLRDIANEKRVAWKGWTRHYEEGEMRKEIPSMQVHLEKMRTDPEYRAAFNKRTGEGVRRAWANGTLKRNTPTRKAGAVKNGITRRGTKLPLEVVAKMASVTRGRAMTAPNSRKGPEHHQAKFYKLRSPSGKLYCFRNMDHFVEQHQELFEPKYLECSTRKVTNCLGVRVKSGGRKASTALYQVAGGHISTWKGWTRYSETEDEMNAGEDLLERTTET